MGDEVGRLGQDGDSQQPTGKAGDRFKVAPGCQPPPSFWSAPTVHSRAGLRRAGLPTQDAIPDKQLQAWIATRERLGHRQVGGSRTRGARLGCPVPEM